jgi:hypothetical protein
MTVPPSREAPISLTTLFESQGAPMAPDKSVPGLAYVTSQTSLLNRGTDSGRYLKSYYFAIISLASNSKLSFPTADKQLRTFTFWARRTNPFRSRVRVDVDLIQTHLTSVLLSFENGTSSIHRRLFPGSRYHPIADKSVAILGFKICAQEPRPAYLRLRGALRDSSVEFHVSAVYALSCPNVPC